MNHGLEVSVIIPVFNGELYLAEAIESVLTQTHTPMEVIIVDDGSSDNSAEIAKAFGSKIRYCQQSNSGAPEARNRGVKIAKGRLLAFLDADDSWTKNKLELQVETLRTNLDTDMVFGHVRQYHSSDLAPELKSKYTYAAEVMPGYHIGTMLVKRESFERVGLFETKFSASDFIDWYLKATDKGLISRMLPDILMKRRLHASNLGVLRNDLRSEYVKVVKASLDRRRKKLPGGNK